MIVVAQPACAVVRQQRGLKFSWLVRSVQCAGNIFRETMFRDVVPIRFFHGTASGVNAGCRSSGLVRALFAGWWVFMLENLFHLQTKRDSGSFVAKKQGLSAIPDEDICIMRNPDIRLFN